MVNQFNLYEPVHKNMEMKASLIRRFALISKLVP